MFTIKARRAFSLQEADDFKYRLLIKLKLYYISNTLAPKVEKVAVNDVSFRSLLAYYVNLKSFIPRT